MWVWIAPHIGIGKSKQVPISTRIRRRGPIQREASAGRNHLELPKSVTAELLPTPRKDPDQPDPSLNRLKAGPGGRIVSVQPITVAITPHPQPRRRQAQQQRDRRQGVE